MENKIEVLKTQSSKLLTQGVTEYWEDVRRAPSEGRKHCYAPSVPPMELLRAMNIACTESDNYGATIMARHAGAEPIRMFESEGFSPETCSYSKAADAVLFFGKELGMDRTFLVPPPDFVLNNTLCGTLLSEGAYVAREFKVPLFVVDVPPFINETEQEVERNTQYLAKQYGMLAEFLENLTGKRLDREELTRREAFSRRIGQLRREGVELSKHIPAPQTIFDSMLNIFAANVMRGTEWGGNYLATYNAEIKERVKKGIGAIPHEKYRLLWHFNIMFPKLRFLSQLFAKYEASIVCASWTHSPQLWCYEKLDPEHPMESMAREWVTVMGNRSLEWNVNWIGQKASEYQVDGVVLHLTRTCKLVNIGMLTLADEIMKRFGLPSYILESDTGDEKYFDDVKAEENLQAFLGILDKRRWV